MKTAYLVIAHGSRDSEANQAFTRFLQGFKATVKDRLVVGAYLELAKPSIPEAIETCVQKGAGEILILPLMLFPGRHVKEDIPQIIQEAKARHPEIDFHYSSPLHDHPLLVKLLDDKAKAMLLSGKGALS